ncbi:MAG: response regulator [Proteobacteria bacterium]|nr:response regulator [Pseudomonadota bacterium]
MKILIVDDDLINRKFLKAMLTGYGETDMAADGVEAVEYVKKGLETNDVYDVVFLDIMMPNMDGHQTLQKIREIEDENNIVVGDGSKIVMVTALANKENVLSAFSDGCEYYLVKPLQQTRLFDLMKEMGFGSNR